mmetsp:Transcript_117623/g.310708  ORF Transcript_117623/g.310708 Transcript_117623/m.310708 type:complete len:464 (+) Transcript_117623:73-1464(+)
MAQFGDRAARLHRGLAGGPTIEARSTLLDTAPEIPGDLQRHAAAPSKLLGDAPRVGDVEIGMPASPSTTASVAGDGPPLPRATVDASTCWVPAPGPEVVETPEVGVRHTFVHVAGAPPSPGSLQRHATAPAQMHRPSHEPDEGQGPDSPAAMPIVPPPPQSDLRRTPTAADRPEVPAEPSEWPSPVGLPHVPAPSELCRLRTFDQFETACPSVPVGPPPEAGGCCPAFPPPLAELTAGTPPREEAEGASALVLLPVVFGTVALAGGLPAASPCGFPPLSQVCCGDSGAMMPRVVPEPRSSLLQQEAPPQLQTVLDPDSGNRCIFWEVDASKLRSKCQAVSGEFEITLRSGTAATFKMMLQAEGQGTSKGARSFRASGKGFVQLKCLTALSGEQKHDLLYRVGTSAVAGRPGAEPPRGPVQHDFAQSAVSELPKGEGAWDFTSCVDQATQKFTVYLEILPQTTE